MEVAGEPSLNARIITYDFDESAGIFPTVIQPATAIDYMILL
jgi:hypothetical protein